jgi:long-chain fatty acid transport protein
MTSHSLRALQAALAFSLLVPGVALAQGHWFPGVGPVTSGMAGAGVALPGDALGALAFNPALMSESEGNDVSVAADFSQEALRVATTLGAFTAKTNATQQLMVAPSFGWTISAPNGRMALGFGFLNVAGFRTDYPQDNGNPLLLAQPNGFGRISTDYGLVKIPIALSIKAGPNVSLAGSFNVYRGTLTISPLPVALPDLGPTGNPYLPSAAYPVSRWGAGANVGVLLKASRMVSVGGSVQLKSTFQQYEWNSSVTNPESGRFGQARVLTFDLQSPLTATFGVALHPNSSMALAVDGQYTKYDSVDGLGGEGGVDTVNHRLLGIGWDNIWSVKVGLQQKIGTMGALRLGYGHSQTPIRDAIVETSMGTPMTFQNTFAVGASVNIFPKVTANVAAHFVPREHVRGPVLSPVFGPVPGSEVDLSNSVKAFEFGFGYRF